MNKSQFRNHRKSNPIKIYYQVLLTKIFNKAKTTYVYLNKIKDIITQHFDVKLYFKIGYKKRVKVVPVQKYVNSNFF